MPSPFGVVQRDALHRDGGSGESRMRWITRNTGIVIVVGYTVRVR